MDKVSGQIGTGNDRIALQCPDFFHSDIYSGRLHFFNHPEISLFADALKIGQALSQQGILKIKKQSDNMNFPVAINRREFNARNTFDI